MHQKRLMGILLDAWLKDAIEMKQTRVFFDQRREREAEGKEWTWAEGEDPISLMDRSVTLKVGLKPSSLLPALSLPPPSNRYSVVSVCGVLYSAGECATPGRASLKTPASGTDLTLPPSEGGKP